VQADSEETGARPDGEGGEGCERDGDGTAHLHDGNLEFVGWHAPESRLGTRAAPDADVTDSP
jgi:hypothetical protein